MNTNSTMTDKQTWLVIQAISKNGWCTPDQDIRLEMWANFRGASELVRNYLCKDGSGYIRDYYDGASTFYVMKYHLRDEEWTNLPSAQS